MSIIYKILNFFYKIRSNHNGRFFDFEDKSYLRKNSGEDV